MPEITCSIVEDLLGAYLSGKASDETSRLLAEHIAECPRCSTMVKLRSQSTVQQAQRQPELEKGQARRIVSKARRRLFINIAVITTLVVALVAVGLNDLYAHMVEAPLDVAGAEAYAEVAVPGARLARALGKAVDYDLQLTDWLTINSLYFTEYNQAYLLYTTSNGTRVSVDTVNGSLPSTPANEFDSAPTRPRTVPPTYYISGGRSETGYHFALPLNLTSEELDDLACQLTLSPSYRVKSFLGLWSIRRNKAEEHIPVNLEWSTDHLRQDISLVYQLNDEIKIGDTTIQISELELNSQFTRLQVITDRSAGATRPSLHLVWDGLGTKGNVLSTRSITSFGDSSSVRDELIFPPMPEPPQAVTIHVSSLQIQKSGQVAFPLPWGDYAASKQLLARQADQFTLDVEKGRLTLVAVDTELSRIIFRFDSNSDPAKWPANTSILAPYSFPPEILGSGDSKQRSSASYIHAPNDPDLRYEIAAATNTLVVEVEVDPEFAKENPQLTLRVKQGPYDMEVDKDFVLDLPQPIKGNPEDPE